MKKWICLIVALLVCGAVLAGTISQSITERQLRDPKQFRTLINDNFAEIDDRTDGTTPLAALDVGGDVTLENDEMLRNDVDGDVEVIFDDDATTKGQLILAHEGATTTLADNDLFEILARAYDSATNATDYVTLQFQITDYTTASEDSVFKVLYFDTAVEYTGLELGTTSAGAQYCDIAPSDVDVAGRNVVVGPQAVEYFIQAGRLLTVGNSITFATAFGGTPAVLLTYDGSAVNNDEAPAATSVSTTGFTVDGYASATVSWQAIGIR